MENKEYSISWESVLFSIVFIVFLLSSSHVVNQYFGGIAEIAWFSFIIMVSIYITIPKHKLTINIINNPNKEEKCYTTK
jgi:hypothetical protein